MEDKNKEQYRSAICFIISDLKIKLPLLCNCLFNVEQLLSAANIEMEDERKDVFIYNLSLMHVVTKTNKMSEVGPYYNASRRLYNRYRKSGDDKKWLGTERSIDKGFCILETPTDIFRLNCRARKCKFFLATEQQCIKGKFFSL